MSAAGFAAIDLSWLYNALIVPVAMVAFFIVFLASNAINILILLSPFTVFDAALKAFRTAIIASIVVSSWANPWIGAAWALIIIGFCYFIAGWSFRLSHFGLMFVWDFVTRRCNRFTPDKTANKMFLGRKINKIPARTYGKLSRDEKGHLVLNYRRGWFCPPAPSRCLKPNMPSAKARSFPKFSSSTATANASRFCCHRVIVRTRNNSSPSTASWTCARPACTPCGNGSRACLEGKPQRRRHNLIQKQPRLICGLAGRNIALCNSKGRTFQSNWTRFCGRNRSSAGAFTSPKLRGSSAT